MLSAAFVIFPFFSLPIAVRVVDYLVVASSRASRDRFAIVGALEGVTQPKSMLT